MPRLDLTSLRYILSLASILAGVSLLVWALVLHDDAAEDAAARTSPEATAVAENPALVATAVPAPPPAAPPPAAPTLPPGPPLVKGTAADCFPNWRFIDNPQQRWTVCLPLNLLYFNGRDVVPFESARPEDLPTMYRDFNVVNEPWFLYRFPATTPAVDALVPMALQIEVVAHTAGLNGCDLRNQPPGAGGIVRCIDRYDPLPDGFVQFSPTGSFLRYRALVPTQLGRSVNEVFSLSLNISSQSSHWPLPQRMFEIILESLKPY